jgi:4-hydroxybenzoate polyprenyltransferase
MSFALFVPTAIGAGAALAIGNAIADIERDRASSVGSVVVALGPIAAWRLHAVLLVGVFSVALASLAIYRPAGSLDPRWSVLIVGIGGLIAGIGAVLARSPRADRRERGWELEAVGVGLGAIGWIGGLGGPG